MRQFLLSLVVFLIGSVAYSGTIDPNTPDSKYVSYGSKFVYVSKVKGKMPDTKPFFGSGVAHKDKVVLTAAHMVEDIIDCAVEINGKNIKVAKIIIHPKYNSDQFGYHDIAICFLEENIGLDWYPELYTKTNETGKVCSISGYGITGTFLTGANISDDKKRAGSNIVDRIDRGLLICSPSRSNRTELEFCIGSGDSGGGLFIDNKIAGINSCVIHEKGAVRSTYGTESGHTRISDHVEWITEILAKTKE
jgi:hypothetical protein